MLKWIVSSVIILLIGSNLFLIYLVIDRAVTSKYQDMVQHERQQQIEELNSITNHFVSGMDKEKLISLLNELGYETFEKDGAIHARSLAFKVDDEGMVTGVKNSVSYSPEYIPTPLEE